MMKSEEVFPYRVQFTELTPDQYAAGVGFCQTNEVAYEDYSGDDRTDMLRTVQATPEQVTDLTALLEEMS
jgi:hypothetical protein